MATNCTFKSYGDQLGGASSEISGVISLADVSYLNISDPLTPTATIITADKQRSIVVSDSDAVAQGIPPGTYEKVGAATFRKVN